MAKTLGIDVSYYQGAKGAPIKAIVAAGAEFVIARATVGTQVDTAWANNKLHIAKNAPVGGAYCFVYGSIDANAQADAFAKAVGKPDGLILAVDAEGQDGPNGKDLHVIGTRLRSHFGPDAKLGVYSSYGYASSIGNPDLSGVYDFCWLAYYVPTGSPPLGKVDVSGIGPMHGIFALGTPLMRQFGPSKAGGLTLDTNVYFGTLAELKAYLSTKPVQVPIPERLNYRLNWNALLDTTIANTKAIAPKPVDTSHPAIAAGHEAGRAAVIAAVDALRITDPPA